MAKRSQLKRRRRKTEPHTVSYIDPSIIELDIEIITDEIDQMAEKRGLGEVQFVEETEPRTKNWRDREIKNVIDKLRKNDRLVVHEFSMLARTASEILEVLASVVDKQIHVYSIRDNWEMTETEEPEKIAQAFSIAASIKKDLISRKIKGALKARAESGVKLGRPIGPGKSKLDKYRTEIENLLKNGSTKRFIARKYKTSPSNLFNWMKKNKIDIKPDTSLGDDK